MLLPHRRALPHALITPRRPWPSLPPSRALFVSSVVHSTLTRPNASITKIRNLGIFAHIDSGKTTLTESILAHSGYIPHPGTVDLGTTSTDFLPAERERGITIQSATIPVQWREHTVNLVDTPGHIDFTMEVERAARVVDGAVVVMDGVEGVEGQTEGVWKQLTRYNVTPRILFINKLDRPGASLPNSLLSTTARLHPLPLILTLPITSFSSANGAGGEPGIEGLVDLVGGRAWRWTGPRGQEVKEEGRIFDEFSSGAEVFPWDSAPPPSGLTSFLPPDHPIRAEAVLARTALIETLSTHYLPLLEEFFDLPSPSSDMPAHLLLPPASLRSAIRALATEGKVLPVVCGSAFKGIGTELLLDAVLAYLPGPYEVGPAAVVGGEMEVVPVEAGPSKKKGGAGAGWKGKVKGGAGVGKDIGKAMDREKMAMIEVGDPRVVALAFKVVWDDMRGWMTFVRVYSGTLTRSNLYNSTLSLLEKPGKLLLLYASRPTEVDSLPAGSIGVLLGLKHTRTGDTLLSASDPRRLPPNATRLRGVDLPNAVCSIAILISGKEEEKLVGEALGRLVRQDPSLRLEWPKRDETTGMQEDPEEQTMLHGMGPLHLEISLGRLQEEQGVKARSGKLQVSMRESVEEGSGKVEIEETWEGIVHGQQQTRAEATVRIELERLTDDDLDEIRRTGGADGLAEWGGNDVDVHIERDDPLEVLRPAIESSLLSAIQRGGTLAGLPLSHLRIHLTPVGSSDAGSTPAPSAPTPQAAKKKGAAPSAASSSTASAPTSNNPPPAAFARAIASGMRKALSSAGPTILEPLVTTKIWGVGPADLGKVVSDLITRGGTVNELGEEEQTSIGSTAGVSSSDGADEQAYVPPTWVSPSASTMREGSASRVQRRTVSARVPLAEMRDYAGRLRSLSGGSGNFETSSGGWGKVDLAVVRKREEADL